jgi:hypothetical protein
MTTPILGRPQVRPEAVTAVARRRGAHERYLSVVALYYALAPRYGVRPEVALAQAAHETGWGHYGGVVPADARNWCGLKTATGGSDSDPAAHARFPDDATGVLAHVQHLAAYAGGPTPQEVGDPVVSPRLHLVRRGSAPTVEELGGKWAPSPTYGTRVAAIVAEFLAEERTMRIQEAELLARRLGLVDRRGELARNPAGGPNDRYWPKEGIVIHYNGAAVPGADESQAAWQQVVRDAAYHVSRDWGGGARGDGLMYHVSVGPAGELWQCRDLDAVLWHCGSWPENASYLSVLVPIGGEQRATPAQLAALRTFVSNFAAALGIPKARVVGHQELSPTSCPGTLMADFVLPYRRGDGGQMADGRWFPETQKFIGGGFWKFWSQFGGLAVFGLPLTDELEEPVECRDPKCQRAGRPHVVQYFERAVFEWHPEVWPERYDVLLRRIGADAARAKGYRGPGID